MQNNQTQPDTRNEESNANNLVTSEQETETPEAGMSSTQTDPNAGASLNVRTPESFSFKPHDWPSWKKRFERYRSVSNLEQMPGKKQVAMLIYSMGEKAEDILTSLAIPEDKVNDFNYVLKAFEDYFIPRKI